MSLVDAAPAGEELTFSIIVGVALHRPLRPEPDEYRKVVVSARTGAEARLIACQVAGCGTVMPVSDEVEWVEW